VRLEKHLAVTGDRNLVVVPEPAITRAIEVRLRPGLAYHGRVMGHVLVLDERPDCEVQAQLPQVHKGVVFSVALPDHAEAWKNLQIISISIPEAQTIPTARNKP
jgi:hypothetical protein